MKKLIAEKFGFSAGRVERVGGRPIIRGVLLCGSTSANRRRYRQEAFAGERIRKYDGRPVYLNHGDGRSARGYEEHIGWVRNPRRREDGMPVEEVESVDVVLDPATTKGLFESTKRRGARMRTTVRKLALGAMKSKRASERTKSRAVALLREAEDAGVEDAEAGDGGVIDFEADADHEVANAVTDGIRAAATAIVSKVAAGDLEWEAARSKLDKLFAAHADLTTAESRQRRAEGRGTVPSFSGLGRDGTTPVPSFSDLGRDGTTPVPSFSDL